MLMKCFASSQQANIIFVEMAAYNLHLLVAVTAAARARSRWKLAGIDQRPSESNKPIALCR